MSSTSDSEEFFDAEDAPSPPVVNEGDSVDTSNTRRSIEQEKPDRPLSFTQENSSDGIWKPKPAEKKQKSSKFRELRKKMQKEEEDCGSNTSPVDSQISSTEEVFAYSGNKMLHPFRVIEHDTISIQSVTSLGRVGRILSETTDTEEKQSPNSESNQNVLQDDKGLLEPVVDVCEPIPKLDSPVLQEPDLVASAKPTAINLNSEMPPPVAPPRRKKRLRISQQDAATTPLTPSSSVECNENIPVYNTEATIENLTRELENSLDKENNTKKGNEGTTATKIRPTLSLSSSINSGQSRSNSSSPMSNSLKSDTKPSISSSSSLRALIAKNKATRNSSTYPLSSLSSHSINCTRNRRGLRLGISPQRHSERRKSTGDEDYIPQPLNMFLRTRTESGKCLTDMEILEQVTVLNLDTGERVPLSIAEDKLPQCINPLSLHIMRLTSEYVSTSSLNKERDSDEESICSKKSVATTQDGDEYQYSIATVKTSAKIKRFLDLTVKKTVNKAKTIAHEVSHVRHKEDIMDIKDEVNEQRTDTFKLRAAHSHKGPYEFSTLRHVQELGGEHAGPVWCMKFSTCGRLLATAGQDGVLRIWVLRSAYTYFQEMRTKYNAERISPTPSQESLVSQQSVEETNYSSLEGAESTNTPFMSKPFCTYTGHMSDLLDISWSKNYFVLSSSMDKTVRLWHISRKECLCCFQHIDFVTAICFHPKDDRYFLSGSLDGKLRLWNIPDKKVAVWNELDGNSKLITAANFCQNGKFAVVGSYDGRCIFYITDQLRYHTQIHVRSTRGKNSRGRKITGIEPMPGEDKILVTSNDSRVRLYDLLDLNLSCKYKGYVNVSSQIKASFSHDGKFIICGSENQCIYIWKSHHDYSKFPSVRRDRNDFWEGIKAHNAVVTCAIFAPNPDAIFQQIEDRTKDEEREDVLLNRHGTVGSGYALVSADFTGCIRVFLNKTKPKHSSLPASALA